MSQQATEAYNVVSYIVFRIARSEHSPPSNSIQHDYANEGGDCVDGRLADSDVPGIDRAQTLHKYGSVVSAEDPTSRLEEESHSADASGPSTVMALEKIGPIPAVRFFSKRNSDEFQL